MRANVRWSVQGVDGKGHTRLVPYPKGAVYPYSSKRQDERNLRKLERVVGTCGNCGGQVTLPDAWMGTYPPVPTCQSCGALAKTRYPMMEMEGPVEWPKKRTGR